MSADNGIYVAIFGDGKIRVVHTQNIEDCWSYDTGLENPISIVDFFGNAEEFENDDMEKAYVRAHEMEFEILNSDFPILEYGVSSLRFQHPFSFYLAEVPTVQHNEEPYDVENDEPWEHTDA